MTIAVGDCIPDCALSVMGSEGPAPVSTADLFNNNKILMFAVPGAFTPGCSMTHLPGYVVNADKIKEMGVDGIICLSVNDAFVMHAWGEAQNANDSIVMLADGNGEFTQALGLEMDATGFGMAMRSQRYALIAEDGKITGEQAEAMRQALLANTGEPWYMQIGKMVLEIGLAVAGVRLWRGPSATAAERVARLTAGKV